MLPIVASQRYVMVSRLSMTSSSSSSTDAIDATADEGSDNDCDTIITETKHQKVVHDNNNIGKNSIVQDALTIEAIVDDNDDEDTTSATTSDDDNKHPHYMKSKTMKTYSAKFLEDNGLEIVSDDEGHVSAKPILNEEEEPKKPKFFKRPRITEQPAQIVPQSGFNVVLTHCTADFDSLASAVGLAKLWSAQNNKLLTDDVDKSKYDSASHLPTFVVLPRGAHPSVQRFLALHKHLFPIRSLKSLPDDLSGLNRLGLVDAQRRDRIGPAEPLLEHATRVTVVDHHIDSDSDIPEATDYVVDKVGSVSTLIVERLKDADLDDGLTEAEATLLALGIHADTGSLVYDSTTARDAAALTWVMEQGASQTAIAEHAQSSLSPEQQGVLTQALINTNSTEIHGVTLSTVLLKADGFINGLAAVTQDAMELSSSDVYLMGIVYEARSGGSKKGSKKKQVMEGVQSRLLQPHTPQLSPPNGDDASEMASAVGYDGEDEPILRRRLKAAFDRSDTDKSGYLDRRELTATLNASGIIASDQTVQNLISVMDTNGDGIVDFEEFVEFAKDVESEQVKSIASKKRSLTLIIIGRVKAGINMKDVNLGKLFEKFGGGGHAKAASATVRLNDESEADDIMTGLVDELVDTSLQQQAMVADFMTAPVLSVKPDMTETQVEDLFTRYDVRALPVVDDDNNVIGLVSYKEVAAAKQRLWNKEQKRLRRLQQQQDDASKKGSEMSDEELEEARRLSNERRKRGSTVKGWMKQHVTVAEMSMTMPQVEAMLLANDVGCIPVVADGTKQLMGMVTRTDLLRQHRYYSSLHYHNKGFSDSIANRKPIIELRKRLKKFDLDDE